MATGEANQPLLSHPAHCQPPRLCSIVSQTLSHYLVEFSRFLSHLIIPHSLFLPLYKEALVASKAIPTSLLSPVAIKLSSSQVSMANKQIIPYGMNPRKPSSVDKSLAIILVREHVPLAIVPPEAIPIHLSQSYFAQAIRRPVIALSPPHQLLEDKLRPPLLDALKLIKVTKEINLVPLKGHEVLTRIKTNKFGDVTCGKYKSTTPRTTIDGVCAMPDQIKVVPPKKRKAPSSPVLEVEKRPRTTIALSKKRIEDLCDVIYTLE